MASRSWGVPLRRGPGGTRSGWEAADPCARSPWLTISTPAVYRLHANMLSLPCIAPAPCTREPETNEGHLKHLEGMRLVFVRP